MILSDQHVLMSMLDAQDQRNCAFRGETEPASLRWGNVLWNSKDGPNIQFFALKHARYNYPEKKSSDDDT